MMLYYVNLRIRSCYLSGIDLKLEIAQLDLDYSNYKRKAQTMLKSQMVPVKDSDEIDKLQKAVHDFHAEVSILK